MSKEKILEMMYIAAANGDMAFYKRLEKKLNA